MQKRAEQGQDKKTSDPKRYTEIPFRSLYLFVYKTTMTTYDNFPSTHKPQDRNKHKTNIQQQQLEVETQTQTTCFEQNPGNKAAIRTKWTVQSISYVKQHR